MAPAKGNRNPVFGHLLVRRVAVALHDAAIGGEQRLKMLAASGRYRQRMEDRFSQKGSHRGRCTRNSPSWFARARDRAPAPASIDGELGEVRRFSLSRLVKGHQLRGRIANLESICRRTRFFYARRSAFATVGSFDDQLKTGADFEWMARFFRKHRLRACFIDHTLIPFHIGRTTNQGLKSRIAINREAEVSCKRHGILTHQSLLWSKYALKALQYVVRPPDFPLPLSDHWKPRP
jgi:hypothetical protein